MTHKAVDAVPQRAYEYKKAAVILSDLSPESLRRVSVWEDDVDERGRERSVRLSQLLDEVNTRFGRGTLHIGSTGTKLAWSMKRERVTPHYTTRWSDVPVVMA